MGLPGSISDIAEVLIESPGSGSVRDLTLAQARSTLIHLDNEACDAEVRIKKIAEAKRAIKRALLGEEKATRSAGAVAADRAPVRE